MVAHHAEYRRAFYHTNNSNSNRGNTVKHRSFKQRHDPFRSTGNRHWNSNTCLGKTSPAGYGNKTSDGHNSQTGAMSSSDIGYKGSLQPIIKLMKEAGHKPLATAYSFISDDYVVPTTYTQFDTQGKQGVQPTTTPQLKRIQGNTAKDMLPPRQEGGVSSRRRWQKVNEGLKKRAIRWDDLGVTSKNHRSAKHLNINTSDRFKNQVTEIDIQPLTQRTLHTDKFGHDGDPNAIYPLAPLCPTEQQGYKPEKLDPTEHYVEDELNWYGEQVKVSENELSESHKAHVQELPRSSEDNKALMQTAVENYLWSTSTHRGLTANANFDIPPQSTFVPQPENRILN